MALSRHELPVAAVIVELDLGTEAVALLDALILACAEGCDATLASFDAELVENGAVAPTEILSE